MPTIAKPDNYFQIATSPSRHVHLYVWLSAACRLRYIATIMAVLLSCADCNRIYGQSITSADRSAVNMPQPWPDPWVQPMQPTEVEMPGPSIPYSPVITPASVIIPNQPPELQIDTTPLAPKPKAPLRVGKGGDRAPLRYRVQWQPSQEVVGQNQELDVFEQDFQFGAPVYMQTPHMLIFSGGIRYHQFNTSAVFPDSGLPFPDELWNIRVGKNYIYQFANGWSGGLNVNIGSASDQPFGDLRNYNFGAIGFVSIPVYDRDAWNLALVYMPMSQIPFPIPSVAYQWNPSDQFSMNIGLPFEVSYRPTEQWSFEASYMLLTTVHAQTTYRWNDQWKSYAAFDWENQSWFLDQRIEDNERLFLYEMRLVAGIQKKFRNNFTIDVTAGYAFDRYFFNGEGFEDRNNDRIEVGAGPFLAIEGALRF